MVKQNTSNQNRVHQKCYNKQIDFKLEIQEKLLFYYNRCKTLELEISELKGVGQNTATISGKDSLYTKTSSSLDVKTKNIDYQEKSKDLLLEANKVIEDQAIFLNKLSIADEEAKLSQEVMQKFETEIIYYLKNSKTLPGLDPKKIEGLALLAKKHIFNLE